MALDVWTQVWIYIKINNNNIQLWVWNNCLMLGFKEIFHIISADLSCINLSALIWMPSLCPFLFDLSHQNFDKCGVSYILSKFGVYQDNDMFTTSTSLNLLRLKIIKKQISHNLSRSFEWPLTLQILSHSISGISNIINKFRYRHCQWTFDLCCNKY